MDSLSYAEAFVLAREITEFSKEALWLGSAKRQQSNYSKWFRIPKLLQGRWCELQNGSEPQPEVEPGEYNYKYNLNRKAAIIICFIGDRRDDCQKIRQHFEQKGMDALPYNELGELRSRQIVKSVRRSAYRLPTKGFAIYQTTKGRAISQNVGESGQFFREQQGIQTFAPVDSRLHPEETWSDL